MDQTFAELRSGVTSYFEQDGIDSVTSLSNPAAALANTSTYDSFGNLSASSGSLIRSDNGPNANRSRVIQDHTRRETE